MGNRRSQFDMTPAELVANAEAVILDFDGPMCDVFRFVPASSVAAAISEKLSAQGIPPKDTVDPLELVRYTMQQSPRYAAIAHNLLLDHELRAVDRAPETSGLEFLLADLTQKGTRLAVASNNGQEAIETWLAKNSYESIVDVVEGRVTEKLNYMKPHPRLLLDCLSRLNVRPGQCVFIGDSLSDGVAARSASVPFIGYANKNPKLTAFRDRLHGPVVRELVDLVNGAAS